MREYIFDEDDDDEQDEDSINASDWDRGYDMSEKEYRELKKEIDELNRLFNKR